MAVAIRHPSRAALAVLAVALPIPLLAAAGLSLPLPVTVERLAAKLVPFGNPAALEAGRGDRPVQGSIVLAAGERRLVAQTAGVRGQLERRTTSTVPRLISAPTSHPDGRVPDVSSGGAGADRTPSTPGSTPERGMGPAPSGATTTTATPPTTTASAPAPSTTTTTTPTPTPTTTTTTTPTSTPAVAPTVTTVTTALNNTVTTATDTAKNTVTTVTSTAGGVVGGLPHP